jgi:predicted helicase
MRDNAMPTDRRAALAAIRRFDQLIAYLRDEMGWPVGSENFEDMTFEYTAEELGIDAKNAAKIRLQVAALRRILGRVVLKKRASANRADRQAWATDDLLFISNYGQGEERQISIAHFSRPGDGHDLPALKVLGWDNLDTPLHLDDVAEKLSDHLAWPEDEEDVQGWREQWRSAFTLVHREVIDTSKKLSVELARLARDIRARVNTVLAIETKDGPVSQLMAAFREALVHDLDEDGFADMYAQTIAYGLLSARIADPERKTADDFAAHMRTNPFLKELMETFLKVGGRGRRAGGPGIDFDELGVSEVLELLDNAKMEAIVRDFGDRAPQEDPVIHFYELFLKEYDASKRMERGVFYTPRPVVSYIVRSVDTLLRTEFGLSDGLADVTTWGQMAKRDKELQIPDDVAPDQAFVQILDPAAGTGTFLVEVVDIVFQTLSEKWRAQGHGASRIRELWNHYVPEHLLPRLHGYELLMAPYAIAHVKIGLKLYETGYRFSRDERAHVYLTNSLEPGGDQGKQREFQALVPALAHEAEAVNAVKKGRRFTVVIGNPPYATFGQLNRGSHILALLEDYKRDLNERKLNLDDDFIKFFRFCQHLIDSSAVGILGLITSHTFVEGITHRRMRQSLSGTFPVLYVLDLHGSKVKPAQPPDGLSDENVFEIKQGVAISLGVRTTSQMSAEVRHSELWGTRREKYAILGTGAVRSTQWHSVELQEPYYFFYPYQDHHSEEYRAFWSLKDIFTVGSSAVQTKRDGLFVAFTRSELEARMKEVLTVGPTAAMREKYPLKKTGGWRPEVLKGVRYSQSNIRRYLYRPFDYRYIYYDDQLLGRSRWQVFRHLLKSNLAIATLRQTVDDAFRHVFCTDVLCDINLTINHHVSDQVFPLYLYGTDDDVLNVSGDRGCNLAQKFVQKLSDHLCLRWIGLGTTDLAETFGAADVFHYIYAIMHSPSYRSRYWSALKIDWPRIPLPRSPALFRTLVAAGRDLVDTHLRHQTNDQEATTKWMGKVPTVPVKKVVYKDKTVWIDEGAGFLGVNQDVWTFRVGAYQVCKKWLTDRKGRFLSEEDVTAFTGTVSAIEKTTAVMNSIDVAIGQHGGWPSAFLHDK